MINILLSRGLGYQPKIYDYLKPYVKKDTQVCIIALSHFENQFNSQQMYVDYYSKDGYYYDKMVTAFAPLGIAEKQISWILDHQFDLSSAQKEIAAADIIYFPGGAPDLMYDRMLRLGLVSALKEKENAIIIGSSAGAMIQNDLFHISKDNEYHKFSIHRGIGYIESFGIEVHFRRRKQSKKSIRAMSHFINRPIYVIEDSGCLIVKDGVITHMIDAYKYYENRKRVPRK